MSWLTENIGTKHGRLTVTQALAGNIALVVCDCGTEKRIFASNLKRGLTTSCGCYFREVHRNRRIPHEDRFWKFVSKKSNGCWEWTGGRGKRGYGLFSVKLPNHPQTAKAYRISWEIANQACLLPGAVIMHTCDNPPCVRPEHLKLGTHKENCDDMWAKGRVARARGEASGSAILTEANVLHAIAASHSGIPVTRIASELSVPYGAIWNAINGRTWRHIKRDELEANTPIRVRTV